MATSPKTHETVGAAHEGASHEGGLPQLQMQHWGGQIVWLLLTFTVVFVLVSRVFAPKLRHAIDARAAKISEDLANARALRDEAHAQAEAAKADLASARAEAQKTAAEAKAKAKADAQQRQAEEEATLNARLEASEAQIRKARDEAMTHVASIATETASAVVAKVLGSEPDQAVVASFVRSNA